MTIRFAVVALLALLLASPVAAEAPAMDIPIYPGAEPTMEINLTNEDLLPTLQAVLPMVKFPNIDKLNPEDLAAAFKDVKRIQMLQLDVTRAATEDDIAAFYVKKLSPGEWNKVFWQKIPKQGTMAVFVQGMGEQLYGFRITSVKVDDKPAKRVQVLKVEGKIDVVKLISAAAKMYMP